VFGRDEKAKLRIEKAASSATTKDISIHRIISAVTMSILRQIFCVLLVVTLLWVTVIRLPAPITEVRESPTPTPEQSAKPQPKRTAKPKEVADESKPAAKSPTHASPTKSDLAVIKTSEGDMTVEFWPEVAPITVENFKKLARAGFYDGTAFHRIVRGFMIQGGDPNTKDLSKESSYGNGGPGYEIPAEFNDRPHLRGVLSMARSEDPNSAGSQFFICLGTVSRLDHQYTTFGKVIRGDDVLGKIGDIPTTRNAFGENSKPIRRVTVESIKIVQANSVK